MWSSSGVRDHDHHGQASPELPRFISFLYVHTICNNQRPTPGTEKSIRFF
nr:unnamed protein product [Callosobruchus chinensis]